MARRLGIALRDRALYKPCWALLDTREDLQSEIARHFADPKRRKDWEDEAARALGGEPGQLLVYCAPEGMSFNLHNQLPEYKQRRLDGLK